MYGDFQICISVPLNSGELFLNLLPTYLEKIEYVRWI